ncbi:hypothetical protein [Gilvibacter sp.]|uniref:hypothetical protein n=1 Tax=Gilvibacter sp. TaxID=2729997 RepID=UPI0025C42A13|nr:hypothetical protein [Gilvibacter sp.]NQX77185.1 hypothetical protein [Gilvibacter sp.]
MTKLKNLIVLPILALLISGCSSTKVLESWKATDAGDVKSKNFLVIARTDNPTVRKAFEDAMLRELRNNKMKGMVSYDFMEDLKPNKQLSEAEIEAAKQMIRDKGFEAVVITVLKDKKQTVNIKKEGGYYAGATYSSSIDPYLYTFYNYYNHPNSAPTVRYSGNYVEPSINEERSVTYVVETLVFDLEKPAKQQLIGQVTSSLQDPDSAADVANGYARSVARALRE